MRYSIEPRDMWLYVKGYGFLSFATNMGKSLSNKHGQKLLDSAKRSTADATKTASKREIQKSAETTGYLIGNKIADKIINVSRKSVNNDETEEEDVERTTHNSIIDELRLVPKNYV